MSDVTESVVQPEPAAPAESAAPAEPAASAEPAVQTESSAAPKETKKRRKRQRVTMVVRRRKPATAGDKVWQVQDRFEDTLAESIERGSKFVQQQATQWDKLSDSARAQHWNLLQLRFGNVWDQEDDNRESLKRKEPPVHEQRDLAPEPIAKRVKLSVEIVKDC